MIRKILMAAAAVLTFSSVSFAAGAHDGLVCTGCHDIHYAKDSFIFAVAANKVATSPSTKKTYSGVTALCLGCHADAEHGGMGIKPISQHTTHPFGTPPNPKIARVPRALLRDSKMDCVSCHDPHPSNPNYRYLRTDTKGGSEMQYFCAMCHPAKADNSVSNQAMKTLKVFTSMDESKGPTTSTVGELTAAPDASPAETAPAAAPAAAPKK